MAAIFKVSFNKIIEHWEWREGKVCPKKPKLWLNEIGAWEDDGWDENRSRMVTNSVAGNFETVAAENAEDAVARVRKKVVGSVDEFDWTPDDDEKDGEKYFTKTKVKDIVVVSVVPEAFTTM
jgi:hypothetical protein